MNKPLPCIILGIVLGALAVLCFQRLSSTGREREDIMYEENDDLSPTLQRLTELIENYQEKQARTLAELSREVAGLKTEMRDLREGGEIRLARKTEEEVIGKERIPPAPRETDLLPDMKKGDSGWVSVLDESLARTLVEAGLTPFDPGVSPLLLDSASKLREIRNLYDQTVINLKKKNPTYNKDQTMWEVFKAEEKSAFNQFKRDRKDIINAFAISLAALKSAKQEKK